MTMAFDTRLVPMFMAATRRGDLETMRHLVSLPTGGHSLLMSRNLVSNVFYAYVQKICTGW
jgi:hypothetical protein